MAMPAESEAQSLAGRITALGSGLSSREALVAPVSGVVASTHAAAGQVVDARELVFEIVDQGRLRIEALDCDAAAGQPGGRGTTRDPRPRDLQPPTEGTSAMPRTLVNAAALAMASTAHAGGHHVHDHQPRHGGVVAKGQDMDYELVA